MPIWLQRKKSNMSGVIILQSTKVPGGTFLALPDFEKIKKFKNTITKEETPINYCISFISRKKPCMMSFLDNHKRNSWFIIRCNSITSFSYLIHFMSSYLQTKNNNFLKEE
jgi:hypothetical protein